MYRNMKYRECNQKVNKGIAIHVLLGDCFLLLAINQRNFYGEVRITIY